MRRVIALALTLLGLLLVALIAANAWVIGFSKPYVYDRIEWLPERTVGLVLGTSPYTSSGGRNLFCYHRIEAAAELLRAGKVEHLLLSGANPSRYYNEPRLMYQALVEAGVPGEAMSLDFAGYRTLDSVVRAHKVFGLDAYTIISQRFHNFRAVFIARHKGVDAVAYSRSEEAARQPLLIEAREFLARVVAVLDLFVLQTKPRYLGEPIDLGLEKDGGNAATNGSDAETGNSGRRHKTY